DPGDILPQHAVLPIWRGDDAARKADGRYAVLVGDLHGQASLDAVDVEHFFRTAHIDTTETEDAGDFPAQRASLIGRQEAVRHRDVELHDVRVAAVGHHPAG